MSHFSPSNSIETQSEWIEARSRLDAYLGALSLTNPEQREQIVSTVLQHAAAKHVQNPMESPTVLVMNEIRDRSEQWFGKILASNERVGVTGFVSLFAIDATTKWPGAFLAEEIPADFQRRLRECEVSAAPDLRVARMVPQPFDSPLRDLNLPTALGQLTKDLSPSMVTKVIAFVLSGFAILWGNRLK